ncbi:MAG TPA: iron-containing redox enzyme family protein [Nannocystaceae bacterium]|nr:iron-containing redox enzyme family protein [Nannocystaceae bacterium]
MARSLHIPGAMDEFAARSLASLSDFHRELDAFNHERLRPCDDSSAWRQRIDRAHRMTLAEGAWIERERSVVAPMLRRVPKDADAFLAWFDGLAAAGPGQGDPLFPWLANTATRDEMIWFLRQELAGEAGFDDLVALTQVGLAGQAKLELARNYWDEMGRGSAKGMHGPMLASLAAEIGETGEPVWEALALANLMTALACNRHLAYQSIGALGAIELTAPGRCEQVHAGLRRLGFDGNARKYYAVHASIDIKHSLAWNREVIRPLVSNDPSLARPIAEGALLRLVAGARCFERYRDELGVVVRAAS